MNEEVKEQAEEQAGDQAEEQAEKSSKKGKKGSKKGKKGSKKGKKGSKKGKKGSKKGEKDSKSLVSKVEKLLKEKQEDGSLQAYQDKYIEKHVKILEDRDNSAEVLAKSHEVLQDWLEKNQAN